MEKSQAGQDVPAVEQAQQPWWRGAVLYQVYLRSFQDSNQDGIGDLPGLLQRLAYIADLGVDGIWITPFFPSPRRDMGY
ncbi:MAG: alpha-amylase family glycosyl hydrolase, partial [Betaproteobacteria bacterium]